MRVIAGRLRGRRLSGVPKGTRPTTDRLRESLFASLEGRLNGSAWLDLFAGTGAIGIEALSRGAEKVIFNERDRASARAIRKNLTTLEIDRGWELHELDAFAFLKRFPAETPLDFIFLDPPYAYPLYAKLLKRLERWPGFGAETILILEIFKKQPLDFIPAGMVLTRRLNAGDGVLLLLQLAPEQDSGDLDRNQPADRVHSPRRSD